MGSRNVRTGQHHMVSFNTTQKRVQGITQSHMKSLSSHISVQDRKTLCSAKAHFPCPAMRPGTPAWCFLLAPPSPDTPMSETAGGDVTFRIISESLTSLYSPQLCGEFRSPGEPCRPVRGAQKHKKALCGCCGRRRGGSALPGLPGAGPAPQPRRH